MKIDYTIEDEKIKICNFEWAKDPGEFLKLYDDRLTDISFLHLKGAIRCKTNSSFSAANGSGVIVSIHVIPHNSRFEFESFNNISVSFTPELQSVQLIMTDVPFRYCYENPGTINRLDIYIPTERIRDLIPAALLERLTRYKIVNVTHQPAGGTMEVDALLNKLIKELEKPKSKSLLRCLEQFLTSVTH